MMMMGGRAGGAAGVGRCPFTASQWQELEHQALIYKYMASGVPVPSDLLLPLRRGFLLDPALAFPPQASLGWGCLGMGFGRKAEDPEPGRCRRTDGKKWRCSKEAYPDSKYCEKHMHRGKNRSRKPVEISLATPPASSSSASSSSNATTTSSPRLAAHDTTPYHALYGSGPYGAGAYHAQVSPFHLHLDVTQPHPPPFYSMNPKDYAYGHSVKEVHGEHTFFSDSNERDNHTSHGQWQFKQLGVESKRSATPPFPGGGCGKSTASPYGIDISKEEDEKERQQQQHCFLLGTDLRLQKPSGHAAAAGEVQKPLRPFFEEWPHEKSSKGSWMGLEGETQLSISIPMAATASDPRYHHGE